MNLTERVRAFELAEIERALVLCRWNQAQAARRLGIPRTTLASKWGHRDEWLPASADDEPLAWVVRRNGERVEHGACWTREEIQIEAEHPGTVAFALSRGDALNLLREINTTIAVRAARHLAQSA